MRIRLGCRRRPLRRPEDGLSSITECGTRLRAACIGWEWLCSSWRIRKNACCEETRGYLVRKPSTSVMATSTMSYFPAGIRSTPMAILLISITELQIAQLLWPVPVFTHCWIGWMPTQATNADIEPRTDTDKDQ